MLPTEQPCFSLSKENKKSNKTIKRNFAQVSVLFSCREECKKTRELYIDLSKKVRSDIYSASENGNLGPILPLTI